MRTNRAIKRNSWTVNRETGKRKRKSVTMSRKIGKKKNRNRTTGNRATIIGNGKFIIRSG
jgi:hypothetical protein